MGKYTIDVKVVKLKNSALINVFKTDDDRDRYRANYPQDSKSSLTVDELQSIVDTIKGVKK